MVAILLTVGSAITIGFGVWHLFVPTIWNWYSYIPREAPELTIAVRAVNAVFSSSLVILGTLMLIFVHRKPVVVFYERSVSISLAFLWGVRVALQVIWPQGSMSSALQHGMLGAFILQFLLFAVSSFLLPRG